MSTSNKKTVPKKEPVNKENTTECYSWLCKNASTIIGIILVVSFLIFIFLTVFDFGIHIKVRTDMFQQVFMAYYGAVTMYLGYIWGASKPQTDAVTATLAQRPSTTDKTTKPSTTVTAPASKYTDEQLNEFHNSPEYKSGLITDIEEWIKLQNQPQP